MQFMRSRKGFTLVELIIVIAILAGLALLVFVAVNPLKRINDARQAEMESNAEQMTKAINLRIVDTYAIPTVPDPAVRDICKFGHYDPEDDEDIPYPCINLDQLTVEGYLSEIPVTQEFISDTRVSGYEIAREGGTVRVCPRGRCFVGGGGGNPAVSSSGNSSSVGAICQDTYNLYFDGIDDQTHGFDNGDLTFATNDPFSVSAWIKMDGFVSAPNVSGTWTSAVVFSRSAEDGGLVLTVKGNPTDGYQAYCFLMNVPSFGTVDYEAVGGVTFGTGWTHVACVSDGTNWNVYTNGVIGTEAPVMGSYSTPVGPPSTGEPVPVDIRVGKSFFSILGFMRGSYFKGWIDDPRVYAGALDQTDLNALVQGNDPSGSVTLRGRWKFDDGAGTTATANIPALDAPFEGMTASAWTVSQFATPADATGYPEGGQICQ